VTRRGTSPTQRSTRQAPRTPLGWRSPCSRVQNRGGRIIDPSQCVSPFRVTQSVTSPPGPGHAQMRVSPSAPSGIAKLASAVFPSLTTCIRGNTPSSEPFTAHTAQAQRKKLETRETLLVLVPERPTASGRLPAAVVGAQTFQRLKRRATGTAPRNVWSAETARKLGNRDLENNFLKRIWFKRVRRLVPEGFKKIAKRNTKTFGAKGC
jgi:hypothetical protein